MYAYACLDTSLGNRAGGREQRQCGDQAEGECDVSHGPNPLNVKPVGEHLSGLLPEKPAAYALGAPVNRFTSS